MSSNRVSEKLRQVIHERAKGCCEYCQSQDKWATQRFVVEHIIPQSKKGTIELENLALACPGCNNHKYNITEAKDVFSNRMASLFHPRIHRWKEHFAWDKDLIRVIGLTPIGRVTVEVLQLNRPRLLNRREAFLLLGFHPPKHTLDIK